jgi:hypothetical protein
MKPEVSSVCSQKTDTGLYPEPQKSGPQAIVFIQDPF